MSPEVIGEAVGSAAAPLGGALPGIIGRKVAHYLTGFPPIWTTLTLTLFADGRFQGAVICHSLFPSMSFYEITESNPPTEGRAISKPRASCTYKARGTAYDGVPNLEKWKKDGWGAIGPSPSGPCNGNPWNP